MRGEHTKGEWFWAVDARNQRTSLMRSGSGDYVISPQADVSDYGLSVDLWNDVSDADAALIEAAPDLLKALRTVEATLPHMGGSERATFHLLADIRAALQKALP